MKLRVRLHHVVLFVHDQERSRAFYEDTLGFRLIADARLPNGQRWMAVSPPDGTAVLALVAPPPGSPEWDLIGTCRQVVLLAEDVPRLYAHWKARGVPFGGPPTTPEWGGILATFSDPDGNTFALVGFDEITQRLEAERRRAEERLEKERQDAYEIEVATRVQARLFPQARPALPALDYAGTCLQARHVGGDYYDFLDLGPGKVGLVVGDISGKGIAAALLMAHLQASLRSQRTLAADDLRGFLRSVNGLFCQNTPESTYATLVFAEYDAAARRLRYASCGHPPALLLRRDGKLERLPATGTAIGLFPDWDCKTEETALEEGDILALYSDGVSEAFSARGEEFGEDRLVAQLTAARQKPAEAIVAAAVAAVRRFSANEPHDDLTLIVAKAGPARPS